MSASAPAPTLLNTTTAADQKTSAVVAPTPPTSELPKQKSPFSEAQQSVITTAEGLAKSELNFNDIETAISDLSRKIELAGTKHGELKSFWDEKSAPVKAKLSNLAEEAKTYQSKLASHPKAIAELKKHIENIQRIEEHKDIVAAAQECEQATAAIAENTANFDAQMKLLDSTTQITSLPTDNKDNFTTYQTEYKNLIKTFIENEYKPLIVSASPIAAIEIVDEKKVESLKQRFPLISEIRHDQGTGKLTDVIFKDIGFNAFAMIIMQINDTKFNAQLKTFHKKKIAAIGTTTYNKIRQLINSYYVGYLKPKTNLQTTHRADQERLIAALAEKSKQYRSIHTNIVSEQISVLETQSKALQVLNNELHRSHARIAAELQTFDALLSQLQSQIDSEHARLAAARQAEAAAKLAERQKIAAAHAARQEELCNEFITTLQGLYIRAGDTTSLRKASGETNTSFLITSLKSKTDNDSKRILGEIAKAVGITDTSIDKVTIEIIKRISNNQLKLDAILLFVFQDINHSVAFNLEQIETITKKIQEIISAEIPFMTKDNDSKSTANTKADLKETASSTPTAPLTPVILPYVLTDGEQILRTLTAASSYQGNTLLAKTSYLFFLARPREDEIRVLLQNIKNDMADSVEQPVIAPYIKRAVSEAIAEVNRSNAEIYSIFYHSLRASLGDAKIAPNAIDTETNKIKNLVFNELDDLLALFHQAYELVAPTNKWFNRALPALPSKLMQGRRPLSDLKASLVQLAEMTIANYIAVLAKEYAKLPDNKLFSEPLPTLPEIKTDLIKDRADLINTITALKSLIHSEKMMEKIGKSQPSATTDKRQYMLDPKKLVADKNSEVCFALYQLLFEPFQYEDPNKQLLAILINTFITHEGDRLINYIKTTEHLANALENHRKSINESAKICVNIFEEIHRAHGALLLPTSNTDKTTLLSYIQQDHKTAQTALNSSFIYTLSQIPQVKNYQDGADINYSALVGELKDAHLKGEIYKSQISILDALRIVCIIGGANSEKYISELTLLNKIQSPNDDKIIRNKLRNLKKNVDPTISNPNADAKYSDDQKGAAASRPQKIVASQILATALNCDLDSVPLAYIATDLIFLVGRTVILNATIQNNNLLDLLHSAFNNQAKAAAASDIKSAATSSKAAHPNLPTDDINIKYRHDLIVTLKLLLEVLHSQEKAKSPLVNLINQLQIDNFPAIMTQISNSVERTKSSELSVLDILVKAAATDISFSAGRDPYVLFDSRLSDFIRLRSTSEQRQTLRQKIEEPYITAAKQLRALILSDKIIPDIKVRTVVGIGGGKYEPETGYNISDTFYELRQTLFPTLTKTALVETSPNNLQEIITKRDTIHDKPMKTLLELKDKIRAKGKEICKEYEISNTELVFDSNKLKETISSPYKRLVLVIYYALNHLGQGTPEQFVENVKANLNVVIISDVKAEATVGTLKSAMTAAEDAKKTPSSAEEQEAAVIQIHRLLHDIQYPAFVAATNLPNDHKSATPPDSYLLDGGSVGFPETADTKALIKYLSALQKAALTNKQSDDPNSRHNVSDTFASLDHLSGDERRAAINALVSRKTEKLLYAFVLCSLGKKSIPKNPNYVAILAQMKKMSDCLNEVLAIQRSRPQPQVASPAPARPSLSIIGRKASQSSSSSAAAAAPSPTPAPAPTPAAPAPANGAAAVTQAAYESKADISTLLKNLLNFETISRLKPATYALCSSDPDSFMSTNESVAYGGIELIHQAIHSQLNANYGTYLIDTINNAFKAIIKMHKDIKINAKYLGDSTNPIKHFPCAIEGLRDKHINIKLSMAEIYVMILANYFYTIRHSKVEFCEGCLSLIHDIGEYDEQRKTWKDLTVESREFKSLLNTISIAQSPVSSREKTIAFIKRSGITTAANGVRTARAASGATGPGGDNANAAAAVATAPAASAPVTPTKP